MFFGKQMPESLFMLLKLVPALAAFIAYLYAADALDKVVRSRYPEIWSKIAGHWDAHSSSNAFFLVRERQSLTSLNDSQVSRLLTTIRFLFWVFGLSLLALLFFA